MAGAVAASGSKFLRPSLRPKIQPADVQAAAMWGLAAGTTALWLVQPLLRNVIEYMLQVNKDPDDEVALEACEFWSAYCETQLPPENLREFLPRLIPV